MSSVEAGGCVPITHCVQTGSIIDVMRHGAPGPTPTGSMAAASTATYGGSQGMGNGGRNVTRLCPSLPPRPPYLGGNVASASSTSRRTSASSSLVKISSA